MKHVIIPILKFIVGLCLLCVGFPIVCLTTAMDFIWNLNKKKAIEYYEHAFSFFIKPDEERIRELIIEATETRCNDEIEAAIFNEKMRQVGEIKNNPRKNSTVFFLAVFDLLKFKMDEEERESNMNARMEDEGDENSIEK